MLLSFRTWNIWRNLIRLRFRNTFFLVKNLLRRFFSSRSFLLLLLSLRFLGRLSDRLPCWLVDRLTSRCAPTYDLLHYQLLTYLSHLINSHMFLSFRRWDIRWNVVWLFFWLFLVFFRFISVLCFRSLLSRFFNGFLNCLGVLGFLRFGVSRGLDWLLGLAAKYHLLADFSHLINCHVLLSLRARHIRRYMIRLCFLRRLQYFLFWFLSLHCFLPSLFFLLFLRSSLFFKLFLLFFYFLLLFQKLSVFFFFL